MATAATLKRTPLYDAHLEAGARMVPFAGWEMPVQYAGVRAEHLAVRSSCGVFDVSHMGQIETTGPGAARLLQRLLTNDVANLEVGGAQYSCLCREDGGVLDDTFTYRLDEERFLTVTNAANHERDTRWFLEHAGGFGAEVRDVADGFAMLAVQGPTAREVISTLAAEELPPRMKARALSLGGGEALVCGTGYTGEDGVEVLCDPDAAPELWRRLVDAGAKPAGLGARDTLRIEVCYPLYGNELSVERTPIEAGLGWCCAESTGFLGDEAVAAARGGEASERLAPFVITGQGIPRQGNAVMRGDEALGEVTSGTFSPSLELGIGMAYLPIGLADPGSEIEIDVRGKRRGARVGSKPLYRKD